MYFYASFYNNKYWNRLIVVFSPSRCLRDGQPKAQGERSGAVVLWSALAMVWTDPCFMYPWARNYLHTGSRQWWTVRKIYHSMWNMEYECFTSKRKCDTSARNAQQKQQHSTDIYRIFEISGSHSQHVYQSCNNLSGVNMNWSNSWFNPYSHVKQSIYGPIGQLNSVPHANTVRYF